MMAAKGPNGVGTVKNPNKGPIQEFFRGFLIQKL